MAHFPRRAGDPRRILCAAVFQADVFDHSVLARMIRRAWAQRVFRTRHYRAPAGKRFLGRAGHRARSSRNAARFRQPRRARQGSSQL